MSGAGFDTTLLAVTRAAGAILLIGFAIKLMDDFMDLRMDAQYGVPSLAVRLGEATLPYSMFLLALGGLLDPRVAMTLFLSSYAVGMAVELNRVLPSGLTGWQEGLLATAVGALFAGLWVQVWSLAVMGFVQCVDDIDDAQRDRLSGNSNLVRRWGLGEIRLAALGLLGVAAFMNPIHTALTVCAVAVVEAVVWRLATQRSSQGPSSYPRGWLE